MKIKITTSCSGLTFSFYEGQTVDVDKKIGEDLVQAELEGMQYNLYLAVQLFGQEADRKFG